MKEAAWLAASKPDVMLRYVRYHASERKLRLLGVALVNRVRHLLSDPAFGAAVDAVERFADGEITKAELKRAKAPLHSLLQPGRLRSQPTLAAGELAKPQNFGMCFILAAHAEEVDSGERLKLPWPEARAAREKAWVALLRESFGNPFRPIAFSSEWRTDTAIALAHTMYETREFSAMPILADALQDAGCDNDAILSHCRNANQPHVRGCWVVDLVLGKQ